MKPPPRMSESGSRVSRGQPMIALAMILAMWVAVRAAFITFDSDPAAPDLRQMAVIDPPPRKARPAPRHRAPSPSPSSSAPSLCVLTVPFEPERMVGRPPIAGAGAGRARPARPVAAGPLAQDGAGPMQWLPGELFAAYDLPEGGSDAFAGLRTSYLAPSPPAPASAGDAAAGRTERRRLSRWSADGWLLMRSGNQPPALAAGNASYGGSQAGAVLRYAFARGSPLRPQAYVRVSGALGGKVQQSDVALGLMARPLPALPLAVLGEWRLQQQAGEIRTRPVVMAITQLPRLHLPLDVEAEAYAQGGWAGGRDATLFYDLAGTLQRRVFGPVHGAQISAGGGVWSGGQRGAVRLDLGPRVELRGTVGPPSRRIGVRVGVDWRFRVAGNAEPGSGPALTVAAGF